jgi:hypothetical protein
MVNCLNLPVVQLIADFDSPGNALARAACHAWISCR